MYSINADTIKLSTGEVPSITGTIKHDENWNATPMPGTIEDYYHHSNVQTTLEWRYTPITSSNGQLFVHLDSFKPVPTIDQKTIKDGDIIILKFDTDIWDIDNCMRMYNYWSEQFPSNKIIVTYKGVEIDIIKNEQEEIQW